MATRSIVELASVIQARTSEVHEYLTSNNIPPPSFHPSTPPVLPLSPEVEISKNAALEALDELRVLLLGPIAQVVTHESPLLSLGTIQRFDIAHAVPDEGTATFAEIAQRCSLPEDDVRRVLRHAMTHYYFREPSKGHVAHTAASKAMVAFPPATQMLGFTCTELWPGALQIPNAYEKWPNSEEPNHCGWSLANNTDKKAYDVIENDARRSKQMADGMSFLHSGPMFHHEHLLGNYEWSNVDEGLLVDIGGSYGDVAIEIAKRFPKIKCVVQDLPEVIAQAKVPQELDGRLTFMEHDFFSKQPVQGADVYLLRWILHNWSDKYAIQILRNLIPAFKKGSRVLVSELCLPEYDSEASPFKQRIPRAFDMFMKQLQNSKERDEEDWVSLFQQVDPRFKFLGVKSPADVGMSIIEAIWE